MDGIIDSKKPLYAVAFVYCGKEIKFEYLHAADANEARYQFCCAHRSRRRYNIIDIAPAVGYFVEDNHGDILSV